jgi:NAD(P)H-nitrite reductase large subunit
VLRTLEDTIALRADLLTASRALIVGDGVLGAEIAATARTMGLPVTMAGPQAAPMAAQIGPFVAGLLADLHTVQGVELRLGTAVEGLTSADGHVTGARLGDGEVLPADVVVIAIGSEPATAWLGGSGLRVNDGLVCDAGCQAAPGIYAAGDVARWHHPGLGTSIRLENRTNATEQAGAVADAILGRGRPYAPVPYFWSDQFHVKLQVYGVLTPDADVTVVEGDPADGRFVALYRDDGRTTGVLGWNMPKQTRLHRQDVAAAYVGLSGVAR